MSRPVGMEVLLRAFLVVYSVRVEVPLNYSEAMNNSVTGLFTCFHAVNLPNRYSIQFNKYFLST